MNESMSICIPNPKSIQRFGYGQSIKEISNNSSHNQKNNLSPADKCRPPSGSCVGYGLFGGHWEHLHQDIYVNMDMNMGVYI